jgi:uncharacterized protein (TIGR03382 family)
MKRFVTGTAALMLAVAAGQATADILISNHPGNDGTQTAGINDGSRTKGMGFEMPGGDGYYLDDVLLRLNIGDTAVQPRIEIFSDVGGGPGASLTTLVNPSFSAGIGDYTFTPSGDFVLEALTTYWIVASSDSLTYDWMASSPSVTPTGEATHTRATFGAYPPQNTSSILVTYLINATPVPAPGAAALLSMGGLLALRRRR